MKTLNLVTSVLLFVVCIGGMISHTCYESEIKELKHQIQIRDSVNVINKKINEEQNVIINKFKLK